MAKNDENDPHDDIDEVTPDPTDDDIDDTEVDEVEPHDQDDAEIDEQDERDDDEAEPRGTKKSDPEPEVFDRKYVQELRRENAKTRREAKQRAAKAAEEAAERAREDFARDLFGALGLDEDDDVDPDELIELANRQRDDATTRLRNYQIKDAVSDAARTVDADLDLLIPHLKGKDLLTGLDPDDDDFDEQVAEIVEAEVAKYPKLKAAPAPARRSSGDHSGGGERKKKKGAPSMEDVIRERREHRKKKFGIGI
ncbi:hypothetical protein K8O93_01140 [Gordonia bronchialis]|uniref:hypothetical protein n=1 Tax=Gordonia bronchialis TaxID=2054 RepID=UPI001CBFAFD5|nr:hypothetical protein [Gordonia bronchialis]UAK38439.1 hypothetical protein K8O93_01140 [Gordonia bronchialis]